MNQFILLWGEMASAWGINRTMAQIHALLYASADPLDTDRIMEVLQISRGNANMNLRSLMDWHLVRKVHQMGSRRDYFTAEKDVWEIARRVIEVRQQREIHPVKMALEESIDALRRDDADLSKAQKAAERAFADQIQRFADMIEIFETLNQAMLPIVREKNIKIFEKLATVAQKLNRDQTEP